MNYRNKHSRVQTALFYAANFGHTQICKILLSHGVDPHQKNQTYQHSALHLAAYEGKTEVLHYLITEWGADRNCKSYNGLTPLDAAIPRLFTARMLYEELGCEFGNSTYEDYKKRQDDGTVFYDEDEYEEEEE